MYRLGNALKRILRPIGYKKLPTGTKITKTNVVYTTKKTLYIPRKDLL